MPFLDRVSMVVCPFKYERTVALSATNLVTDSKIAVLLSTIFFIHYKVKYFLYLRIGLKIVNYFSSNTFVLFRITNPIYLSFDCPPTHWLGRNMSNSTLSGASISVAVLVTYRPFLKNAQAPFVPHLCLRERSIIRCIRKEKQILVTRC